MRNVPVILLLLVLPTCAHIAAPTSDAKAPDVRTDFLHLIDRPRVPLSPEITNLNGSDPKISEFRLTFAADSHNRVPAILLIPSNFTPPRPVVICLHGTGGTKSSMLPMMRKLAAKGFITIAPDAPYHGERSKAGKGQADYEAAILAAYTNPGSDYPFFYDTVFDTMRIIDYLQTRPDVDSKRIALYGVSKGGIETYLTAAVDPRVAAAVPTISMESFKWALDNNQWQPRVGTIPHAFADAAKQSNITTPDAAFVHTFYNRVAPNIDSEFDGPSMITLIAPRPLLLINGELDPRNPLPALKICTDAASSKYHAAKADDHFSVLIEPNTAHKVTPDAEAKAIDWLIQWLKP